MRTVNILLISTIVLFSFTSEYKTKNLIKIKDNYYVDKYEITNGEWLFYVNSLKNNNEEYKSALPDTTVWLISRKHYGPYVQYYFRHPAYSNYPVVGITYEQAIAYCNWRTKNNNKHYTFRLPTKSEWIEFSKIDISKKYKEKIKKTANYYLEKNGTLFFGNFQSDQSVGNDFTAPVDTYYPNSKGIYNLFGNVSELVSEKGIAMGGDFNTLLSTFTLDYTLNYQKASYNIGFRCVAEK